MHNELVFTCNLRIKCTHVGVEAMILLNTIKDIPHQTGVAFVINGMDRTMSFYLLVRRYVSPAWTE